MQVLQRDRAAVAGAHADLLDHAVAGGQDARAGRRRPVDAGMHAVAVHDRVPAHAEAGGEAAVGHRLSHQEFLRALAGVVVEVDRAVGGIAEAVEAVRDVAERQRRVEDLGGFRRSVRVVGIGGIDDLQIVVRRQPRLGGR